MSARGVVARAIGAGLILAGALGCKREFTLLDEPSPRLHLRTLSGMQVALPASRHDVLLYFFASW